MKGWFFHEKYSTLLYVELFGLRINVLLSGSVLAIVVSSTGTVGMGSKQAFEAFVQVLSSFLDFKKDGWQRFLVAITPPGGIGRYCIVHNLYLSLQISTWLHRNNHQYFSVGNYYSKQSRIFVHQAFIFFSSVIFLRSPWKPSAELWATAEHSLTNAALGKPGQLIVFCYYYVPKEIVTRRQSKQTW